MNNPNTQSIHHAVSSGDVAVVHEILRRDPSCVNEWNDITLTPLHLVCKHISELDPVEAKDELSIMALLLDYGADVNARGGFFFDSPLHFAVRKQQISKIKFLLDHKADPNIMDKFNRTALHLAVENDNIDIIEFFVTHEADVHIGNYDHPTPLDIAIARCRFDSLRLLVSFNAKSPNIYESLHEACYKCSNQRDKQVINYVLSHGATLDIHNNFSREALLYYLEREYHTKAHKKCFLNDVLHTLRRDINYRNYNSNLHQAALGGDDVAVETFIEEGADVDITNFFGDTPLHLVLQKLRNYYEELLCKKHNSIAKLLIEHGRNLRKRNFISETPLLLAQKLKDKNLAKLLLKKITAVDDSGILRNQDKLGLQELNAAVALGDEKVVIQLLGTPGMNEEIQSYPQNVKRALFTAADKNNHRILKILLEAGFRTDRRFCYEVPFTSQWVYLKCDKRILCLFWQFNDSVAMDRVLANIAESIPSTDDRLYLPIFYYAICLQTNDVHLDLIPVRGLFKLFDKLSKTFSDCHNKLEELKEKKVLMISYFDIIIMRFDAFVKLLKNKEYLHECSGLYSSLQKTEKLSYDEFVLKTRIELALEKRQVLDTAKECLNELLEETLEPFDFVMLPEILTGKILSHLNVYELRKLAK